MSMEADKISNHENEIFKFFGEHTIVTPPRSGFKEALIKKINDEYINSSSEQNNFFSLKIFKAAFAIFIVFVLSIFSGFSLYISNINSETLTSNERVATYVSYSDGILQKLDRSGNWKDLKIKEELNEGDDIRVLGKGRAVISFNGRGDMRLDSNSQVELNSLKANHIVITNNSGEIYTRVNKNSNAVFEVFVDEVSYQSLGTAFKTINTETTQGVEVYESKVKISNQGSEVVVNEGNRFFVKNSIDPSKENIIEVVEIEEIASDSFVIWNKQQDESKYIEEDLGILSKADPIVPKVSAKGSSNDDGILISWNIENKPKDSTLKVFLHKNEDPTINNALETFDIGEDQQELFIGKKTGEEYNLKVCVYKKEDCVAYSKTVNILSPKNLEEQNEVQDEEEMVPLAKSLQLKENETLGGVILYWTLEPNETVNMNGFRLFYDEKIDETGEVIINEVTINDTTARKHIIYLLDSEIYSYIKICGLNTGNECFVESNEIVYEIVDNDDENSENEDIENSGETNSKEEEDDESESSEKSEEINDA